MATSAKSKGLGQSLTPPRPARCSYLTATRMAGLVTIVWFSNREQSFHVFSPNYPPPTFLLVPPDVTTVLRASHINGQFLRVGLCHITTVYTIHNKKQTRPNGRGFKVMPCGHRLFSAQSATFFTRFFFAFFCYFC